MFELVHVSSAGEPSGRLLRLVPLTRLHKHRGRMWSTAGWETLRNRLTSFTHSSKRQVKADSAASPSAQSSVFIPLIQDFVEKRVSAQDFETRYLRLVKSYPALLDDRVSRAVNYLFCEVDALVLDERLRDPADPNQIEEATLRVRAKDTLREMLRVSGADAIEDSVG